MTQRKEKQAVPQADLIYLAPPFNSNANYGVLYKSEKPTAKKPAR